MKKLLSIVFFVFLLSSCELLMYDGKNVPPKQIPEMEHLYTKYVPAELTFDRFAKAVLSGVPEDTNVLIVSEPSNPAFIFLSSSYISKIQETDIQNPMSLMRSNYSFGAYAGNYQTNMFIRYSFVLNFNIIDSVVIGTNNNDAGLTLIPGNKRIPYYDFQNKKILVFGYDTNTIGVVEKQEASNVFFNPKIFTSLANELKNSFILFTSSNYPATNFWNSNTFAIDEVNILANQQILLLRVTKQDQLVHKTESYLFLYNMATHALSRPVRVLIPYLPSVLFTDNGGNIWVLQAVNKTKFSTTFHFFDQNMAIQKKLIVYGSEVFPLGIQTISGENGLVFLVRTFVQINTDVSAYLSVFFLPLSKLGEL